MNRLVARRLAAQQLARPAFAAPADLVAWMGAVQAQDYGAARWALGARLSGGAVEADLERAVADGSLLRLHALRGTWQLVARADARWILALVGPRMVARATPRYRELGLGADTFRRSHVVLERALRGGAQLTRAEVAAALGKAGISTAGQRLSHLMHRAELDGLVCSGARRGKQSTYTLLDLRAPAAPALRGRDDMLAELARRYFASRGPATLADFTWWSGLTAAEARAGLEAIRGGLASESAGGQTYFGGGFAARAPVAHLLPAFDEYLIAYQDRGAVLDPARATRLNAGGGVLNPCVVAEGRVVGTWRRTLGRARVTVELELFAPLGAAARRAIDDAAGRYGRFLGLEASVAARKAR